jgi:iron complex transport system substrate-binding protein
VKFPEFGRRLGPAVAVAVTAGLILTACGSGGAETPTGPTRVVKHAMAQTEVPEHPKRIVVLDQDKLDTLHTLGITPAGAALPDQASGMPKYLGPDFAKVKKVGTLQEPDLEAIAAIQPDLILGTKFRQEKFYAELAKIAPTVFTEKVGITWKENFLLDAEAVGKKDEGRQRLDAYEAQAKQLGRRLGDPAELKISLIRFRPDEIRQYGPESFAGIVLNDIGLGRPQAQLLEGKADRRFAALSPERVGQADGDMIFVSAFGQKAAQNQATVTGGPLWEKLGAVKAGRVKVVDDEIWMTGIGVTAAGKILADVRTYVTPLTTS